MDAVNSMFESIKERFSNPFIFSFFFAWIFHNWPITIGLLWLEPPHYIQAHIYFTQYVSHHLNLKDALVIPLGWAILYTFGLPFLKLGISGFSTWIGKKSEENDLKILKGSKISMDKYVDLKETLRHRMEQLEKLHDSADLTTKNLNEVNSQLIDGKTKINNLNNELQEYVSLYSKMLDVSLLDGHWIVESDNIETGNSESHRLEFRSGSVYLIHDSKRHESYYVRTFQYDPRTKTIQFTFVKIPNEKEPITLTLTDMREGSVFFRLAYLYELTYTPTEMHGYEYSHHTFIQVHFKRLR